MTISATAPRARRSSDVGGESQKRQGMTRVRALYQRTADRLWLTPMDSLPDDFTLTDVIAPIDIDGALESAARRQGQQDFNDSVRPRCLTHSITKPPGDD
jgi:hypothetical protein